MHWVSVLQLLCAVARSEYVRSAISQSGERNSNVVPAIHIEGYDVTSTTFSNDVTIAMTPLTSNELPAHIHAWFHV